MNLPVHIRTELGTLTDSLSSSIRWRTRDYEAILRAELETLAGPDAAGLTPLLPTLRQPPREI